MLHRQQNAITREEWESMVERRRGFGGRKTFAGLERVDVAHVTVEKCFVPSDFNEELPLYFLDLGEMFLVLFGQWMFDPYKLAVPPALFDAWVEDSFFESFSLRYLDEIGEIFRLEVAGPALIKAQPLPSILKFKQLRGCQFVAKRSAHLVEDLKLAGLI